MLYLLNRMLTYHQRPRGQRVMTGKEVALVLLAIPLLMSAGMAWSGHDSPESQRIGLIIFFTALSLALLIGAFYLRELLQVGKPDLMPDILAQISPTGAILRAGDVDFIRESSHSGMNLHVQFAFQNLYDAPTRLTVKLSPATGREHLLYAVPPMTMEVPGGAVVATRLTLPLRESGRAVSFGVNVTAKTHGGRRVRFAKRPHLTIPTSPLLIVVALIGSGAHGHPHVLHGDAGSGFTVHPQTTPPPADSVASVPLQWEPIVLWSPTASESR